jgi:hypothetical protein
MDRDLIQWMASVLTEQMVEMVIERNVIESHLVEAGVTHSSPMSPIIFAIDTSRHIMG